jgi:hypothetical protein
VLLASVVVGCMVVELVVLLVVVVVGRVDVVVVVGRVVDVVLDVVGTGALRMTIRPP